MISLSNPEHGWMTLKIINTDESVEITFSDAGPDSISQLREIGQKLRSYEREASVEFFLEPEVVLLHVTCRDDNLNISMTTEGQLVKQITYETKRFLKELEAELIRITPLCNETNWTH